MKTEIRHINPELAEKMLKLNTNNRPLCERRVADYAKKMRDGHWLENGESIVVTNLPRLGSGQHRLHAIIKSQCSFNMVVVTGVDDAAFPTLDTGKTRTAGNVLSCMGVKSAAQVSSVLTAISRYQKGTTSAWNTGGHTADTAVPNYETYGDVSEFVSMSERIRRSCPCRLSILAGALFWMNAADRVLTLDFVEKMATGTGLSPGDPELLLRARLAADATSKARLPKAEYAALIAVAMKAKLSGKKINQLRWITGSEFPSINNKK